MADGRIRGWWHAYQQRRADGPWPRRSPRRFRAVIMPGIFTVLGLLLIVLIPTLPNLGLVIFLAGLASTIISLFLAALSD